MITDIILGFCLPLVMFTLGGYLILSRRNDELIRWVDIAVRAAEQIFEYGQNDEKFEYVFEWISNKFKISKEDLKNLIESSVYTMKIEYNKNK